MKDEALKLALEALEMCETPWTGTLDLTEAITAIKQALAAPVQCTEQEPVSQYYDTQFSEQERKVIAARGLEPLVFNRIVPPVQRTEQEPVQEPVAWEQFYPDIGKPQLAYLPPTNTPENVCYTTPPAAQRQWVGLTDEEMLELEETTTCGVNESWLRNLTRAIEAKLKEKNT
jgi:hypothetical protein